MKMVGEHLQKKSSTDIIHLEQYAYECEAPSQSEMIKSCDSENETVFLSRSPCCLKLFQYCVFDFPCSNTVVGGNPTITVLCQRVLQNCSSFLRLLWLHSLWRVQQEGTWEFEYFQICHTSHTDKLFGQSNQDHVRALYDLFSSLYLAAFVCCASRLRKNSCLLSVHVCML